jgi:CheY-like chemotaxis protein
MKKVLIVEDDAVIALINKRMVEKIGHTVYLSVSTGLDAIEACRKTNPDIILMDIQLDGDINGIEAMEKIRVFSSAPVIYLSANSDNTTRELASKTLLSKFLTKPVALIQLQNAIGEFM